LIDLRDISHVRLGTRDLALAVQYATEILDYRSAGAKRGWFICARMPARSGRLEPVFRWTSCDFFACALNSSRSCLSVTPSHSVMSFLARS
jgi:hypothetical protein